MEIIQNKPITYDELYAKVTKFIKKEEELDVINAAYGFALENMEIELEGMEILIYHIH